MSLEHFGSLTWDIALIDPDGFLAARNRRRPGKRLFPHLGLGYLAACLEKNGDRVSVLDTAVATNREIQRFLSQPYNVVGITTTSFTFREAQAVARACKRRYPSTPVIIGGPHASIDPEGCLQSAEIDYALRGEGETALIDFIEVLKRTSPAKLDVFAQVPGLIFRDQGQVRVNPSAARIQELDQLPYPAWHLFPMRRYRQHVLLSSRGCPMDCAFCAIRSIWGTLWLRRDPEQVVNEIEWLRQRWGKKLFHINDDNLTMNPEHITRFCDEILRRRLTVNWVAQGMRADAAQPEILAKMRKAGCHRVSLGIESIDETVLAAVGKKETPEDMARAIALCRKAGIQVLGMFMIGNPQDSVSTVKASLKFAKAVKIDLPAFYMALPYPRTRLWNFVKTHGRLLNEDYLSFDHMSAEPVFATPEFSAEQRRKIFAQADKFCRRQVFKYHMIFWWPTRLLRRNGYEIAQEVKLWLKAVFFPLKVFRFLFRRWSPGGTK
ncbi:B12-binding domain-containing radical SAM protein [bacterium]|nr:B12-binding domain-containing radical SAM protein [bacterium]